MKLEKESCALLVVDAIDSVGEDAADDTVYAADPDPAMAAFRAKVARAVDLAHGAGLPVIFVNDAHIPGLDRELELWGEHGIANRTRIFPEVDVHEDDFIITKRRYSGFFQTDLGLTLNELGVRTLIVVGFDTNICVAHTLADAFYRNFKTVVVEDATITFLGVGTQEGGIESFPKLYASEIVGIDELADLLA